MQMGIALGLDTVVVVLQVGGLAALIAGRCLSAMSAYLVFGAARLRGRRGRAWRRLSRGRCLCWGQARRPGAGRGPGRMVLHGPALCRGNSYFSDWLLAGMLGVATTAAYAACISLVLFSNPFLLGLGNVLMPRTARARADGGIAEVRRVVRWATAAIVPIMGVFCGILTLYGSQLLRLLDGAKYDGYGQIVAVLAWSGFISSLGIPLSYSCLAAERSDVPLVTKLVRFAVGIAASVFLIRVYRDNAVMGAALGLLVGETVGLFSIFFYTRRVLAAVERGRQPDTPAEPRP